MWLTGLPAAGKSTLGACLERLLVEAGRPAYLIDGDNVRHDLCSDLGFGPKDRQENVRRLGELAKLFADAGLVAVVAAVSPYRQGREEVRRSHEKAGLPFFEVHVDTPVETCELRDPKGLYAKARSGELDGFTGVDDPYEPPAKPEATVRPQDGGPALVAAALARHLGLVGGELEELAAPA